MLEKLFLILATLCEDWWWEMDAPTWEQIFMLSGAILGGMDDKGKGKRRDDETIEAAARCLWALLRQRSPEEDPLGSSTTSRPRNSVKFSEFKAHSRTRTFVPIIGQTVNSLLDATTSQHLPLQRLSLQLLHIIIVEFMDSLFVPSILPGVISSMCKAALGTGSVKRWANGDIVASALLVVQEVVVRAIGNDVCMAEGLVRGTTSLEDLVELRTDPPARDPPRTVPYVTPRTPAWLKGSSSQLHIALNSLSTLVNHPSASALLGLAICCATLLRRTSLTLPQSSTLLLSYLLSLSTSDFDNVRHQARKHLLDVFGDRSETSHILLQTLLQIAKGHLVSIPRLISARAEAKLEYAMGIVEAICDLGSSDERHQSHVLRAITSEVAKLLGPSGGVERWGWSLLSVLEFTVPSVTVGTASAAQLMLESEAQSHQWVPFPEVRLRDISSQSAQDALERMFRALGRAAQEDGLFAVEWFLGVGRGSEDHRAIAALWCGLRILEGVGDVSLQISESHRILPRRKRLDKFSRWLAKALSELWDEKAVAPTRPEPGHNEESNTIVEHTQGLVEIRSPFEIQRPSATPQARRRSASPTLHQALALQGLAVCAGVLQSRFVPLLLHTLYPVLNSLISDSVHLSSSAYATLHYITYCTSYASPANLLLSNFDYALDAVSRRLSRRWLDVNATRVLAVLVRLVGRDVVQKAGDVVEECFDRLDEYHGYEVLVDGLITVLVDVVVVVGSDENNFVPKEPFKRSSRLRPDEKMFDEFLDWFEHRHDQRESEAEDIEVGPVPRKAWGEEDTTEEPGAGEAATTAEDPLAEPPPTPTQALTKLVVSRSMFFLTHGSPLIRSKILTLLSSAVPVLPPSALLGSVHKAWPFILNRLSDTEPYVVRAAATLVETLAAHVGDFMYRRVWDDVWPRFRGMLRQLEAADASSALSRRGAGAVGTESAYTHSHRLYTSILRTMGAAAKGVQPQETAAWEVIVACRRFLHKEAHEELQACARDLYMALGSDNEDAVWVALSSTAGDVQACPFLYQPRWDITDNMNKILAAA